MTGLLEPQSREFGTQEFRDLRLEIEDSSGSSTATVAVSIFVGAAMFLGLVASALFYMRRRRRQMERDRDIEPERTDGCECPYTQLSFLLPHLITVPLSNINASNSHYPEFSLTEPQMST